MEIQVVGHRNFTEIRKKRCGPSGGIKILFQKSGKITINY